MSVLPCLKGELPVYTNSTGVWERRFHWHNIIDVLQLICRPPAALLMYHYIYDKVLYTDLDTCINIMYKHGTVVSATFSDTLARGIGQLQLIISVCPQDKYTPEPNK